MGLLFVYLRFLCLKEERQEREDFNAPPPVNPELGQSAGMIVVEVRDEHPPCTAHCAAGKTVPDERGWAGAAYHAQPGGGNGECSASHSGGAVRGLAGHG